MVLQGTTATVLVWTTTVTGFAYAVLCASAFFAIMEQAIADASRWSERPVKLRLMHRTLLVVLLCILGNSAALYFVGVDHSSSEWDAWCVKRAIIIVPGSHHESVDEQKLVICRDMALNQKYMIPGAPLILTLFEIARFWTTRGFINHRISFNDTVATEAVRKLNLAKSQAIEQEQRRQTKSLEKQARLRALEQLRHAPPHLAARHYSDQLWNVRTSWIAREVARGTRFPPKALKKCLNDRHVDVDEFNTWVDILRERSVYFALETLGLLESAGLNRPDVTCPSWLFLSIPSMVRTAADVPYVVSALTSPYFRRLPQRDQSVFVSRAIQHFLMVKHYLAARETVSWICQSQPHFTLLDSFERFIQAIVNHGSRPGSLNSPPAELLSLMLDDLLVTMSARGCQPNAAIYRLLLHPSVITNRSRHALSLLQQFEKTHDTTAQVNKDVTSSMVNRVLLAFSKERDVVGAEAMYDTVKSEMSTSQIKQSSLSSSSTQNMLLQARRRSAKDSVEFFDKLSSLDSLARERSPRSKNIVDKVTWSTLFAALAGDEGVTAEDLLRALHRVEILAREQDNESTGPLLSSNVYHSVLLGLLKRDEPELVLTIWDSARANGFEADKHLVDVICRAMCATGQADAAERLLETAWSRYVDEDRSSVEGSLLTRADGTRTRAVALDVVPYNNLMTHYRTQGMYSKVWETFIRLGSELAIKPDAASLVIVMDAARHASAAAGRGYGPGLEGLQIVKRSENPSQDDMWVDPHSKSMLHRAEPACKVAERLGWRVLEENWPRVAAQIIDPLDSNGFSVLGWLSSRPSSSKSGGDASSSPIEAFAGTLSFIEPPMYPHLFPTERFFRSFIQLLGFHSSSRSIPLVLAWMRHLGVKPTPSTLTIAFMYIGELGLEQKKMNRLQLWCEGWLGEQATPTEHDVAAIRRGRTRPGQPVVLGRNS
ncbi:hypothetical protein OIO90_003860 [Microbotryomycetes sp. JL221]|nr:hypothetical protein OIO90_003860 [Microbotryomycetes sp. JL221]